MIPPLPPAHRCQAFPPAPSRYSHSKGFTLIELMIAMTLVALMVSLLFGGIRLANKSWDRVDAVTARSSEMRQIWRFLGNSFQQARAEHEVVDAAGPRDRDLLFFGTPDAVEFVAPLPDVGIGGLNVVRLEAIRSGDEQVLLLTRWLFHADIFEGGPGIPAWRSLRQGGATPRAEIPESSRAFVSQTVLLDPLEQLRIDYFGVLRRGEEARWSDRWDGELLPELVRIAVVDGAGPWPEMVFALPLR